MAKILFVDLDESLIKTDIFREQLMRSMATAPWATIKLLIKHKLRPEPIKAALAKTIVIDPATLPYNQEILNVIQRAKDEGRKVVLATATHTHVAHNIAQHLGLFDAVLATTDTYNCKGKKKLVVMQEYAAGSPFDYVGDSRADLPIFAASEKAIIVGNVAYAGPQERFARAGWFKPLLKAIRPHQWAKNGLIFLPLFTSHHLNVQTIMTSLLGFVCFSMAASAIYLINDMVDVEDDRHNAHKKKRPFAKGALTVDQGLFFSFGLLATALVLSLLFLPQGLFVLGLYVVITFFYSFSFKTKPILDVFCLSTLYAIRVVYGEDINYIESSSWLLAFCVFFFLSLAFMKRTAEIKESERKEQELSSRRGYELEDKILVKTAGICSGLLSILVFLLYINSDKVTVLYHQPDYLWGTAYVLLYWKLRLWMLASRGQMHQDPIIFALKDKGSYATVILAVIFGALAKGVSLW